MTITNFADTISHANLNIKIQEQELDVEIRQLVNSFNMMIGRLRESFEHITEFSSHVAHELKTPLAIVKGEIELALSKDNNPKEYKKVLAGCLEEIERIIIIIRDLLLLAKLDYKPDIFKFEKLNLIQFFEEIYEHSKVLASSKNIEVKLNNTAKELFIKGDKVHLRRLFYNIIGNAVKFTPPKGNINISLSKEYPNARIDISDTGKGIAEENLHRIFNKFYRTHEDANGVEPGIGLGLSVALSIAKAHRGDIKVKSELNKGSTFSVILPLA
jgi:signal transduction histidine kinase